MGQLLSQNQWDKFNEAINSASDTFNTKNILWYRKIATPYNHGEQSRQYSAITLKCLVDYNATKSNPTDKFTNSGKVDDTDVVIFLNNQHLADDGHIDANGQFEYNQGEDYFFFDGETWIDAGKTPASQSDTKTLHTVLILSKKPRNNIEVII